MTDAQAIEAARRGEHEAFAVLVERYQRMVEAVAYGVTRDPALVDDVVQDTFVTAWRTLDRLRDDTALRPWLTAIARNQARSARRRRQRDAVLGDLHTTTTPFDAVSDQEHERELNAALAGLPARYREPIVLFYYEHCTVKEVADALALREDAVMQRLSRGRRRLGEALATRIEIALESRPSRAALAGCVLALLVPRTASAATATGTAHAGWWRLAAGLVATTIATIVLVLATQRSSELAAKAEPAVEPPAPADPATPPALPELADGADDHVYRNIAVASIDPKVSCARGAAGLVYMTLGKDALRIDGDRRYFEPTPALQATVDRVSTRAAETCGGDSWPEIYVMCEGTLFDIMDGNVTCYPYDPFEPDSVHVNAGSAAVDHALFADAGRRVR